MTRSSTSLVLGFPSCVAELVAVSLLDASQTVYLLLPQAFFGAAAALKKKYGKKLQLQVGHGDLLDFGLNGRDYLKIAEEVDTVYCLYAEGDHQRHRDFNGMLVRELVEFCKVASKIRQLLLLSDFTFTRGFGGIVAERDCAVPVDSAANREAPVRLETVLRRFGDIIPLTVVRSGTMVGTRDTLFPVVLLALGYPEYFTKSNVSLLLADVGWVARCVLEIVEKLEPGMTFHLFQNALVPRELGARLMQLAMAQLPRTFDVRTAARNSLAPQGNMTRRFAGAQFDAKIENSWTNACFRAHNFQNSQIELNWQPLIENEVEKLTGFR